MTEKHPRKPHALPRLAVLALSALAALGCVKGAGQRPAEKAEAAAERFLEGWSKGESPDQFAGNHPTISASDPDWKAGSRLQSFLSVETNPSQEDPRRFRCKFAISLRDRKGKVVDKEVVYEVVLGEKCVISREQR